MKNPPSVEPRRGAAAVLLLLLLPLSLAAQAGGQGEARATNFLLITADDLNYDSVGCYGCELPGITPHIDRLAADGMRFTFAHVNIAVCQPCRQSLMTGRYPHRNGAKGFEPIDRDVPTLQESLRAAGYLNGILGKEKHLKPTDKFCWDLCVTEKQLASGAGIGRDPQRYYEFTRQFLDQAKAAGKPFFLMANSHDPHRPFAGSAQEQRAWGHDLPKATRRIADDAVDVPGFLPDLPKVRQEVAEYFTSVHRCDQTVGAVLRALRESGLEDDTMVLFLSDNGMALPFAKANCYLTSTKTPWIVRWPGRVQPGSVESEHLVSGIDYMPTVLDAAGIPQVDGMDGFTFLPLLAGEDQAGREYAFTEFHMTFARRQFPMRCVHDRRFGYLFNAWAGRTKPMRMDSTSGRTFQAMQKAAASDPAIAARVALFEHRVPEELYDFAEDPDGLRNLIDDPDYRDEVERLRGVLEARMKKTGDPLLRRFQERRQAGPLQVYVLAGQSNMEGQGALRTFPAIGDDPETAPLLEEMLDARGEPVVCDRVWITYPARGKHGQLTAGYGADDTKIGPEFTFGLHLQQHLDGPILLIKTAWGGKSLHTDFRPPSGGPYELNAWQRERYQTPGHGIPKDLEQWLAQKREATGHYYRRMIADIQAVLRDLDAVCPDYDRALGYELAGFVWFQGWNDYCDFHTYPHGDEPGGYDLYAELLGQLIRDVRKDLMTPALPFLIGVFGVRGLLDPDPRTVHFRQAMAAPAALPEFRGNVVAVPTAPYWVEPLEPIYWKKRKVDEMHGKLQGDELAAFRARTITPEEEALWQRGGANGDYHYLGSARTFAEIGQAFAAAVLELTRRK